MLHNHGKMYHILIKLHVDTVVLLDLGHDEGTLDGTDVIDVAKFVEDKLLVLFHITRAYFQ